MVSFAWASLTCLCSTSIIHPSDIMILFQKSSFPSIASVYSKAPIVFVVLTIHIICDLVFSQDRVWLQSDIHLNFPGTSLEWKKTPRRKRLVSLTDRFFFQHGSLDDQSLWKYLFFFYYLYGLMFRWLHNVYKKHPFCQGRAFLLGIIDFLKFLT